MFDRQPTKVFKTGGTCENLLVLATILKTVLDTLEPVKVKSRATSKQRITVVKMTSNQNICSQRATLHVGYPLSHLRSLVQKIQALQVFLT